MSTGDKNNSGSKGNNFTWQHKVLIGLQTIGDIQASTNALTTTLVNLLSPTTRAANYIFVPSNTVSTIPAGHRAYSITNSGLSDALVDGVVLPSGLTLEFDAGGINDVLGAISYDSQLSTLSITTVS